MAPTLTYPTPRSYLTSLAGQCEVAPVQHLQFNGEESGDFCVKSGFVKGGGHMVVKIAGGGFPGYGAYMI